MTEIVVAGEDDAHRGEKGCKLERQSWVGGR